MSTLPSLEYDLIIVGAGIIGCAAARAFGRDGRQVLLLERDLTEPDRIVGELLQPGGVNSLHALDLQDCIEGIDGIPCHGYGVFYQNRLVEIPYPLNNFTGEKAVGKSFHHGRFITKLRNAAKQTPNVTVRELTVVDMLRDEDNEGQDRVIGVKTQSKDGQELKFYAPLTIVADGLFSRFRKQVTVKTPDVKSNFVGFELKDLVLPLPEHGHVILAHPSPVLMYQISEHDTRILVDVPGQLPSASTGELKKYLEETVAPELPESIRPKFLESLETERLRSMPNGFLPPSINNTQGMVLLGDAMNMRHPLTGGGMTVALNDVVLLSDLLSTENVPSFTDIELVMNNLSSFHWKRKSYCTAINVLAMALYRLFAAGENEDLAVLQRGCFRYFQLGGECINGPVGLLSGLVQRPSVLVYHFFSVAFYSIYCEFQRGGWANAHYSFIRMFTVLYTACVTILPYLFSEAKY
ncbi:squalene epoxidase-domain-containing protein [Phycomyces nitens]|nr:squalene epoxidase-domain-containing protein [Phycomyces nitens]